MPHIQTIMLGLMLLITSLQLNAHKKQESLKNKATAYQYASIQKDTDKQLEQIDKKRLASYTIVANKLACMSDQQINDLLATVPEWNTGWGKTASITIDEVPVFVKKIPLTELEKQPAHLRSTANIFNLPLFYQYGVGSGGFGVWREIAALNMASNWALTGACKNFPLLYHTRILQHDDIGGHESKKDIEESVQRWNNSSAVKHRLQAMNRATSSVAVFSESIPQNLHSYLAQQVQKGPDQFDAAVKMADQNLEKTASFMAAHGMIHFDAHAHNIMTDGHRLYFADFGLALSSLFDLSDEEKTFFAEHKNYDKIYVQDDLICQILEVLKFEEQDGIDLVKKYQHGYQAITHSPYITSVLKKYANSALVFDEFITSLRTQSKLTPYPAQEIAEALAVVGKIPQTSRKASSGLGKER